MDQSTSKLARAIDRLYTWSCIFSGISLLAAVLVIIFVNDVGSFFDQGFGASSLPMVVFSIFVVVFLGPIVLLPFVSIIYLISGIFSQNAFDQKGVLLSSFAVISSALAVLLAIDQSVCDRLAPLGGDCVGYKFGFLFDQFSKGGFGDIFDIYDWKLSVISTSELDGLAKIYTLNFRMISALYLAMLAVAIYRRFFKKDAA